MVGGKKNASNLKLSSGCYMTHRVATTSAVLLCVLGSIASSQAAFVTSQLSSRGGNVVSSNIGQTQSRFMGSKFVSIRRASPSRSTTKAARSARGTQLGMFLGTDGGILGVGAPEIAVTLLVGYFILGPSELYKLTKEIGKFVQNFRTLGAEATRSFEDTMENQLEINELRKAQSELNNAFNFRRSINTDSEMEAFVDLPEVAEEAAATAATGAAAVGATVATTGSTTTNKKKRKRRRVKKMVPEELPDVDVPTYDIPDLDMTAAFADDDQTTPATTTPSTDGEETEDEFTARIRAERMERLQNGAPQPVDTATDWATASESDIASELLSDTSDALGGGPFPPPSPEQSAAEQSRFAAQMSAEWNAGIVENEDELSPLAKVMDRLSILEKERDAANARLDEEFQRRTELEEEFYREKRKVLEDAAGEISSNVYGDFGGGKE